MVFWYQKNIICETYAIPVTVNAYSETSRVKRNWKMHNTLILNSQHSVLGLNPENGLNLFITFKKNQTKYKKYE